MPAINVSPSNMPDAQERIGMISSMISETFCSPWVAEAVGDREPHADIACATAPGCILSHALMSPIELKNRIPSAPRSRKYYIYFANQTQQVKVPDRATIHVPPQEFMIMSSDTPCDVITTRPYTTSSLVVDADLFNEYVPNHEALIAQRLEYPFGLREVLHATLDSCVVTCKTGRFAEAGPHLVRAFLEMLALVKVAGRDEPPAKPSTALDIRRAQVKSFIERYYHIPDLTIGMIADRLQLTPRYVQLAFEAEGIAPSDYLRQCRVEACARQLRDPASQSHSITDIAFGNGFNSSSHFSTEFKRLKGMSPREWRSLARSERDLAIDDGRRSPRESVADYQAAHRYV